ncbi:hypothetical protein ACFST9_22730 [Hymenobacter monticola]|uniref:Lipoprotein n=1 Tax=Hymenobacter monticola TaxID=1705399 RepID=A0ABY4B4K7_9BACT|nr:hypothetical protein [Hymenobacter monticola]UOE34084.1 hypothetical protein MTP16_00180 [Hymenobacter monticola]
MRYLSNKRSCGLSILALMTAIACSSPEQEATDSRKASLARLLERRQECQLEGGENYPDTASYVGVRDAAYAYGYVYPKAFEEVILSSDQPLSDTLSMVSPDRHATLRLWPGKTISFPLGAINDSLKVSDFMRADSAVENTIAKIKQGQYPYLHGATIDYLCHGVSGYAHSIGIVSHNTRQVIIHHILVSELPVSGDLVFKNLAFAYDKGFAKQYHAVGITVANSHEDPF